MSTYARFYVEDIPATGSFELPSEITRHAKALRIQEGTIIGLFDGNHEYQARFQGTTADILQKSEPNDDSGAHKEDCGPRVSQNTDGFCRQITLAISFPKGSRLDWLIEKATELGVHTIIPLITKRTIVQPRETKVERLRKLAIAACEQCGRTTIPLILDPVPVDKLLVDCAHYDACILADVSGNKLSLSKSAKKILAIVGPEGGFTSEELNHAKTAGCTLVSLGPTTLRTETAGIVLLSLIRGA
ncbi:16S rRNA (uracil(1498)-N(3))-methyltransferase [Candidatus Woesearchaeota archaeon]|nr:16S rRNA (uracil(1498)-N(3))-methyltransferase [Candidatus Woesearchaeota archaeon]